VSARQPERVGIGEHIVRTWQEAPGGLAIYGLGSCVAVFIHWSGARAGGLGGLAHILLPEPPRDAPPSGGGAFAAIAIPAMVEALRGLGCRRRELRAKVTGGAHMFSFGASERETLGERNIRAALQALSKESIVVAGMDIGGSYGRTLVADLTSGAVRITSLKREMKEI
jgi:chemotaxis protein CheD